MKQKQLKNLVVDISRLIVMENLKDYECLLAVIQKGESV